MINKQIFLLYFIVQVLASCGTIQYKTQTKKSLPELATLGVFENYVAQEISTQKSIVDLSTPLRLKVESVVESKRAIFQHKDSIETPREYIHLEILDQLGMLDQINNDKGLVSFLRGNPKIRVVTKVAIEFPPEIQNKILSAQELYLTQNKQKTLSIEIRRDNKIMDVIEFSEGKIIDYTASEFCWGSPKGFKVQIMDIVPIGYDCIGDSYKTYKKAKRKADNKF